MHHGFNNLRGRDFIWEPKQAQEYLALPRWRRALERAYRSALGPALYYFIEIWWKLLFFPNRRQMPTPRLEFRVDSWLAAAAACTWVGLYLGRPDLLVRAYFGETILNRPVGCLHRAVRAVELDDGAGVSASHRSGTAVVCGKT